METPKHRKQMNMLIEQLELGQRERVYQGIGGSWLRWFTPEGELLPIGDEQAQAERERADALAARLREYEARYGELD